MTSKTPVSVVVPSWLSHTGEHLRREFLIDDGVADLVRRLNHPVFGNDPISVASCDGHGQTWPSVHLVSGDVLVQLPAETGARLLDSERQHRSMRAVAARLGLQLPTRWVDQDQFGEDEGNCFAACVASMLGLDLLSVPNFCADKTMLGDGRRAWFSTFRTWLHDYGLTPVVFNENTDLESGCVFLDEHFADTLVIVAGMTDRGLQHATVWRGGTMVHDPHPSRAGLTDVRDVFVFVQSDPQASIGRRRTDR